MHIFIQLSALHIEYIYEYFYIPEDIIPLWGKVVLHECFLPSAIPKVQDQITEESDMRVLHIDWGQMVL